MGLLQNIAQRVLGVKVSGVSSLDRYIMSQIMSPALYPDANTDTYLKAYTGNGDVFTVINKITEPAASLPIYQYDKDGKEVDGRMIQLLNKPNPYMSRDELIEAMMTFYLLFGDSYLAFEKISNGLNAGLPLRLDPLPPQWTEIVVGTVLDPIAGYRFLFSNTASIVYEKSQVFHWKEFNPDYDRDNAGHLKGMSRLRPILKNITGSGAGYDALVASFQHQGAVGLLTILGEDGKARTMSKQSLSYIKNKWKEEYSGAKKAGSIVITDKDHKWTNFGLTPVELNIIKALSTFRGSICDAYNVPEILMAGSEGRTYANYQEAQKALWTNAIMPSVDGLLSKISKWLAPFFKEEGQELRADYSEVDVLQQDTSKMITWMVLARSFTKNEIREAAGFDRLEDPAMDQVYENIGVSPLSDLGMPTQDMTEDVLKRLRISDYRHAN